MRYAVRGIQQKRSAACCPPMGAPGGHGGTPSWGGARRSVAGALAVLLALALAATANAAPVATQRHLVPRSFWLLSSTGQVFPYGHARRYGMLYRRRHTGRITRIKGTPDGRGYWIVTTRAHYGFGDARRYRYRMGGTHGYSGHQRPGGLHGRIISIASADLGGPAPTKTTQSSKPAPTPSPTSTQAPDCSSVAIGLSSADHIVLQQGTPFSRQLPTSGPAGTWAWSVRPGNTANSTNLQALPSGMSLSGGGVLAGTPTTASTSTNSGQAGWITFTATDSACPDTPVSVQQWLIVNPPNITITTSSLPSGQADIAYGPTSLAATGGSGSYTWTASGLPAGLSISSDGVISGSPASSDAAGGTTSYTVTIAAADAHDGNVPTASDTYSVKITPASLRFVTSTLTVVQGQAFTGHVIVTGGVAPYNLSVAAGSSLPSGLRFDNGTISGITNASTGSHTFTVQAADSQSFPYETTETFALEIAPAGVEPDMSVTSETTNPTWGGYIDHAASPFTLVSGTFTVPTFPTGNTANNELSPWVGIGGDGTGTLIQTGVDALDNEGRVTYKAWWEIVPDPVTDVLPVNAGDTINVAIWQTSVGEWEITLNDLTNGAGFAVQEAYTGDTSTAEWIVEESPGQGAVSYTSTSTFSGLSASQTGSGVEDSTAPGLSPGPLTSSGFTLSTGY